MNMKKLRTHRENTATQGELNTFNSILDLEQITGKSESINWVHIGIFYAITKYSQFESLLKAEFGKTADRRE